MDYQCHTSATGGIRGLHHRNFRGQQYSHHPFQACHGHAKGHAPYSANPWKKNDHPDGRKNLMKELGRDPNTGGKKIKEENERENDRLFVSVGFDNGMGRDISRADGSVSVVFDIGGEESRV